MHIKLAVNEKKCIVVLFNRAPFASESVLLNNQRNFSKKQILISWTFALVIEHK